MARGGSFSKLSRKAKTRRSAGAWAALQGGGEEGVPEWVPMGAIGFADFRTGANGNYWDGTAAVTADQMFVDDPDMSAVFDSATLTADGLPGGSAVAPDFTIPGGKVVGLLGAAMLEGCQMVATFNRVGGAAANGSGVTFEAYHFDTWASDLFFQADGNTSEIKDYAEEEGTVNGSPATEEGVSRFAVELDLGTAMTASINGEPAIETTATNVAETPVNRMNFKVNGNSQLGGTCYLQTLEVYPKGYANLQTLSAL